MLNLNVIAPSDPSVGSHSHRDDSIARNGRWSSAQRLLLAAWSVLGLLPLTLQLRSYTNFIRPHRVPQNLLVPSTSLKQTENLIEICPVEAYILAGVWWNLEATHYYTTDHGIVCHAVMPQYNLHGNYLIGSSRTNPSRPKCKNASFPINMYLYHGSIGFYSFYDEVEGTFCSHDRSAYVIGKELGTYDINGVLLTKDTGSREIRLSYWYCGIGSLWLVYRSLILRRSYILCRRYGQKCEEMGESLHQGGAIVFVQESLRLSAHEATNYQRCVLLYLVVEGIMTDLFLLIASEGWTTRVQYASLGYNLSGLILLLFEMLESTRWLREKWRLRIKRLFFSYETALAGELVSALAFQKFLTGLNRSDLKRSKEIAVAASYYVWSLVGHGVIALVSIAIILSVRVLCALTYVWLVHRSFAVLSECCCIDTVLGVRSRVMLLGGYQWEEGKLYYKPTALRALGLLKMEDEGIEVLVMHKLQWFTVPKESLIGIGVIDGQRVEPSVEKSCVGVISFFHRRLGGLSNERECYHRTVSRRTSTVTTRPRRDSVIS